MDFRLFFLNHQLIYFRLLARLLRADYISTCPGIKKFKYYRVQLKKNIELRRVKFETQINAGTNGTREERLSSRTKLILIVNDSVSENQIVFGIFYCGGVYFFTTVLSK